MFIIWYNPDLDVYQKGTSREFDQTVNNSMHPDRFDILYEFSHTSQKLVDKILHSLNAVRTEYQLSTN